VSKSKGDLLPRVITAIVAVPILLWIILAGGASAWLVVVFFATVVGLFEFYEMTMGDEDRVVGGMGVALGSLLLPALYFTSNDAAEALTFMPLAFVVMTLGMMLAVLFGYSKIERAAYLMGVGIAGIFYVAFLTSFLALLRKHAGDDGPYWILLTLVIVWSSDTGAYFVGRAVGRRRLAPKVSPKKSWEGAIGGTLAAVGGAFLVVDLTPLDLVWWQVLVVSIPAAILGQLGDLCESLIKRSVGVKDSGTIIYGHGGILDRVDALIFAAPYVYFFFVFFDAGLI